MPKKNNPGCNCCGTCYSCSSGSLNLTGFIIDGIVEHDPSGLPSANRSCIPCINGTAFVFDEPINAATFTSVGGVCTKEYEWIVHCCKRDDRTTEQTETKTLFQVFERQRVFATIVSDGTNLSITIKIRWEFMEYAQRCAKPGFPNALYPNCSETEDVYYRPECSEWDDHCSWPQATYTTGPFLSPLKHLVISRSDRDFGVTFSIPLSCDSGLCLPTTLAFTGSTGTNSQFVSAPCATPPTSSTITDVNPAQFGSPSIVTEPCTWFDDLPFQFTGCSESGYFPTDYTPPGYFPTDYFP